MNKIAVCYIRVSSEEQVKNYSLGNQADKCKEYCKNNGYELLKIFRDEGKSAVSLVRPALIELLEYCKQNKGKVTAVIIYKIDRMSRSTYDYLEIKRRLASYGVTIVSITEPTDSSPTGEFLETLMAAQARLDNAIKSERTKDGMTKRLESGLPTNPLSVGYKYAPGDNDKNYPVRDDPRFTLLQQAGYDYMTGIYTKKQIATLLNNKGFTTRNAQKVGSQFISKFFANEFYRGIIFSKVRNKYYTGKYEKMFSDDEWTKIQQVSNGNSYTAQPKKRNNPDFPLRHFIISARTGKPISGAWSKGRSKKYAYYRLPGESESISTEVLENEFVCLLESIKPSKQTLERFSGILKAKYNKRYQEITSGISIVNKELEELQNQQKVLVEKNLTGVYDDELFTERNEELKDKIAVKKLQITEGSIDKLDIETICTFAEHFITNLSQTWRTADLDTKQRIQEIIFPNGVVYDFPGLRINSLSCLFEVLGDSNVSENHLGWPTGIEPATSASTEQHSTIELRPP